MADVQQKQQEFRVALARYQRQPGYRWLGHAVSVAVLAGQAALLGRSFQDSLGWGWSLALVAAAWLLTDFLNGFVHLLMDHHDHYRGWTGPLTAAFHLHHKTPRYQDKALVAVYFHESGFKLWLPVYLGAVLALSFQPGLPPALLRLLALVGVLSSVAELSHYLCHNSHARWARALATAGLLLSKRRHARHHREDNVGYAFLNGWSDPLLDLLARRFFRGYKQGTDLHVQDVEGQGLMPEAEA